ncbi:hypothetical protein HPB48_016822 [Haemaphysalis longicornis]|uniref:Uncharacterized protein n=1 Tax=Haemaphysalis longicornis TaxID=44386 RepID=A0A9J6H696_HAELO|nr:hypothetical protein HPB48_016822 [Haemaphysalis longicornis]
MAAGILVRKELRCRKTTPAARWTDDRRATQVSATFWSVQPLEEQRLPPRNNCVECWHSRFSKVVVVSHPGVWPFISRLQQEQKAKHNRLEELLHSQQPPKQRKAGQEAALERIWKKLRDIPVKDFLREIAHQLKQRLRFRTLLLMVQCGCLYSSYRHCKISCFASTFMIVSAS